MQWTQKNYHQQDLVIDEEPEIEMAELAEDAQDYILANELEKMARQFGYTGPCKECKMGKEVNSHQAIVIRKLESKIASMQRRLTTTDEKKKELFNEKNKVLTENSKLKNDLQECQVKLVAVI